MNSWNGIGRLTSDPELRYLPNGTAVCNFKIAVNRDFKNANGEYDADFVPIQTWRQLAEICANSIKKGDEVAVKNGRIQTRSFDGNDGKKQYVWEVVAEGVKFLRKKDGQSTQENKLSSSNNRVNDPFANDSMTIDIDDDSLPF